jgi:hypothetical protein
VVVVATKTCLIPWLEAVASIAHNEQKVSFIATRQQKKIDLLKLPVVLKLISRDDFMTMLSVLMNFTGIMLNQLSQEL